MSSTEFTEVSPCKHRLRISIPAEDIESSWKKTLVEISKTVSLPGFRRGKVPPKVLESRYAKELQAQVTENLVTEHFEKVLEEKKWSSLSEPRIEEVDFDRASGLNFTAVVEVRPEFELKQYRGIALERSAAIVDDEMVARALHSVRRQQARLESCDEPVTEGGHLTASAVFTVAGESVLERPHIHLHAGHDHLEALHVTGLGEKLLGAKPGDKVTLETTLDDHFPVAERRGAEALLTLSIEEVKVEVLPELDEAFFKALGIKDEEALRERLRQDLQSSRENEIREEVSERLLDAIAAPLDIPLPEDLLRRQCLNLIRQGEAIYRVAQRPVAEQDAALQEEIEKVKAVAAVQIRNYFILEKVADAEKVFVTEKEVARQITLLGMERGLEPEAMLKELREKGGLAEVRLGLRERKTVEWLLEHAEITVSEDKLSEAGGKGSSSQQKHRKTAEES